ncbi:MAG: response regulator [Fibrobacteres bacterium]|nr:response regulator [Fibrobacterota bacterium]
MRLLPGASIRTRLLVPLAILGAALAVALFVFVFYFAYRSGHRQLDQQARMTSNIAAYASESFTKRGELQRLASALGADPEIRLVLVAAGEPLRVVASSRPGWIGSRVDSLPTDSATRESIRRCLANRSSDQIIDHVGGVHLTSTRLTFHASGPHGPGYVSGILLIQLDASSVLDASWKSSIWMATGSALLLLLVLVGVYFLLSAHVLQPLSRLVGLIRGERTDDSSVEPSSELRSLETAWRESKASSEAALRDLENQKSALDHHAIVSVTDTQGNILYVNDKFCAISGYTREELLGKSHNIVNSGTHTKSFFAEFWKTIQSGRVWTGQLCNRAKDGALYWVWATVVPLLDLEGKPEKFIAIRTDITDQIAKEERLQELNRSLESQKKLALELASKAEAASIAKGEFLANMSHEIRTPMNGVIGMTNLLLREDLTPRQIDRAKIVLESAQTLLALINDILDFSKIEAGKLELVEEDFQLTELIQALDEFFSTKMEEKKITFRHQVDDEVPHSLRADRGRLRQILLNLLGNALKFTDRGEIALRIEVVEKNTQGILLKFSVTDTGIGIEPSRLDLLFSSFSQVDSSITRKYGGTGLGLAITKQLSQLMGGSVGVESTAGKGSTFWFTARFRVANPLEGISSNPVSKVVAPEIAGLPKARILVADDNEVNRMVCSGILEMVGWDCESVENGEEALEALRKRTFDLVLLDMQMPVLDGLASARRIRAPDSEVLNPAIPILALTANAMPRDADACMDAGMNGVVTKPIDAKLLISAIRSLLLPGPDEASTKPPSAD